MLKCDVKKIREDFGYIDEFSRGYGGKRRAKGAVIGFVFTTLRDGMGFDTHIDKNINGKTRRVRPTVCAAAPGSKSACNVVGTYFINAGEDWEPKYHASVPPEKIDQLAVLMKETGAKAGVLAGQIDSTSGRSYGYHEDPEMIRIYTRPPGHELGAGNPALSLPLEPISDADARHLCGLLGAKK